MLVQPARRLFTVDEYHRMGEAGILHEDDRVELIEGEIVEMAPIGNRHFHSVMMFTHRLVGAVGERALVSVQNPVRLSPRTEPQPDVVLLRLRRDYRERGALAEDVLLLVEVADTTLGYDRGVKLPLYARAGVPEVWIVDIAGEAIEVYRGPAGAAYRETWRVGRGERLSPAAFPEAAIAVDEFL